MLTGVILAGGKGIRFGGNKALTKINGQYLIEWIIETYKEIFEEIIISTNTPSEYGFTKIKTVKDFISNGGPLIGIYSCLKVSRYEQIFVSACDMPFIRPSLIRHMVRKSADYDVVVPSLSEGMLEPLHALYKKSCLPAMKQRIKANQVRVVGFYNDVSVYTMDKEEILRFDPDLVSFFNINTKTDLDKARGLFKLWKHTSSHEYRS